MDRFRRDANRRGALHHRHSPHDYSPDLRLAWDYVCIFLGEPYHHRNERRERALVMPPRKAKKAKDGFDVCMDTIAEAVESRKAKPKGQKSFSNDEKKTNEDRPWLIKPGEVRNPAGRPKGSRNKLNEDFIAALSEDFQEHGKVVIQTVRVEQPAIYLKVVAGLQPKEIDVRDKTLEDLTDSEIFDALASIRSLKTGLNRAAIGKDRKVPQGKEASRRQLN